MSGDLLTMPAAEYHQDPCPTPSLSSSIAKKLLNESPLHAWTAHPRLNPNHEPENKKEYDFGTVCHSLLLEDAADVVVVDADSWRTKLAKEERDAAYDAGHTPILAKDWERAQACVNAARKQLEGFHAHPALLAEGSAEKVLSWDENGVQCRARLDWLRDDYKAVDDLKTTARSANPEGWARQLFSMGYDVQAEFYTRGLKAVTGVDAEFRLIVLEVDPPYALSVVALDPAGMELANAKVDQALKLWAECLENNSWPGYPSRVCYAEVPGWEMARWSEREARQGMEAQMYRDEEALALGRELEDAGVPY